MLLNTLFFHPTLLYSNYCCAFFYTLQYTISGMAESFSTSGISFKNNTTLSKIVQKLSILLLWLLVGSKFKYAVYGGILCSSATVHFTLKSAGAHCALRQGDCPPFHTGTT